MAKTKKSHEVGFIPKKISPKIVSGKDDVENFFPTWHKKYKVLSSTKTT
jgi:hypothetical protein